MSSDIPGVDDIVDDTDTDADQGQPAAGDEPVAAQGRRQLVVPGNIMPWIEQAADEFGVPRNLLAAVIYQHSRFTGLNAGIVAQVAGALADSFDEVAATGRRSYPGEDEQNELELWLDAAANYAYGSTSSGAAKAYRTQIGKVYGPSRLVTGVKGGRGPEKAGLAKPVGVTLGADKKLPAGKYQQARFPGGIGGGSVGGVGRAAKAPIIPGLSDDDASAVQRIADSLFLQYMGRFPTNEEYRDLSKKKWTQQQLEQHLRAQPVPGSPKVTLGRMADMRDLANRYAQEVLGRDASEGEINWLVSNGIPTNVEHLRAFYQQIKDKAVWHGDPVKWLDMRRTIEQSWGRYGLTGDVPADLVNRAIDGAWTQDDIRSNIELMPAPGFPQGVSVGDVNRVREIAAAAKKDLLPGESVTPSELAHLVGMSPDEIRNYYRQIIPRNSKTGLPAGAEADYRALAESVLAKYGVTGYVLTPEDLKFFALTGADPQAILEHFATNPAIAAQHPGLAYGMQTEDYRKQIAALQDAYGGVFPGQKLAEPRAGAAKTEREGTLAGYALSQGLSPGDLGGTLEQFRQERGGAPTVAEFRERASRPAQRARGPFATQDTTPTPREREPSSRVARPAV